MSSLNRIKSWYQAQRLLVSFVIMFVFVFLGWFFFLRSQIDNTRVLTMSLLETLREDRDARSLYVERLRSLEEALEGIDQKSLPAITTLIYNEDDLPSLYRDLESFFHAYNLKIISLNLATSESEALGEVTINVIAEGDLSYDIFKNLLSAFDTAPHMMSLENISYTPSKKSLSLVIKSYYRIMP